MRKLKILLVITLIGFTVSSCLATGQARNQRIPGQTSVVNSWIGAPVNKLIAQSGGPPHQSFTRNGRQYIVYETDIEQKGTYSEGVNCSSISAYGSLAPGITSCRDYIHKPNMVSCIYTWEIRNGIIIAGSAKGENCAQ